MMSGRGRLQVLTAKAKRLDANVERVANSTREGKRYMVTYKDKRPSTHFGAAGGSTFLDHGNKDKRAAWRARHSKIKLLNGLNAYKAKGTPAYWSWHLLWT
jgi:hypothetical protein